MYLWPYQQMMTKCLIILCIEWRIKLFGTLRQYLLWRCGRWVGDELHVKTNIDSAILLNKESNHHQKFYNSVLLVYPDTFTEVSDWRRSWTYGRAPNAVDIMYNVPSKHRQRANLFTVIPRNRPISVALYDAHIPNQQPAVSAMFPWCTHARIPLCLTYHRPSRWPITALHDQPRPFPDTATLTTLNIVPPICTLDFYSRPQMNNSSNWNANRQSYEGSVPEMRIWPILLIKFDLKWCIHLSRSLFLYLQ